MDNSLFSASMLPHREMPEEMDFIARIVGESKALRYAKEMGGVTIYIMEWTDDPELWSQDTIDMVDFFGIEDTKRIIKHLGVGQLLLPNCKKIFQRMAHKEALELRGKGWKNKAICRKLKLHERTLRLVFAEARKNAQDMQGGLFDG